MGTLNIFHNSKARILEKAKNVDKLAPLKHIKVLRFFKNSSLRLIEKYLNVLKPTNIYLHII